mmetsp:Transcript_26859/g.61806  ORF Transcript_26859/g.61806 Transcript_26859/m.61806 type:complete len:95 (+) Transcript_26859:1339-1623(+)
MGSLRCLGSPSHNQCRTHWSSRLNELMHDEPLPFLHIDRLNHDHIIHHNDMLIPTAADHCADPSEEARFMRSHWPHRSPACVSGFRGNRDKGQS